MSKEEAKVWASGSLPAWIVSILLAIICFFLSDLIGRFKKLEGDFNADRIKLNVIQEKLVHIERKIDYTR